jgi:hypothetical protein
MRSDGQGSGRTQLRTGEWVGLLNRQPKVREAEYQTECNQAGDCAKAPADFGQRFSSFASGWRLLLLMLSELQLPSKPCCLIAVCSLAGAARPF